MTTARIEKTNLVLDGKKLEIFGCKGFENRKKWVTNTTAIGPTMLVEVDPCPQSEGIEEILNTDIDRGWWQFVDHLLVNPATALFLFLEGKIHRTSIINAETTTDKVTFSRVIFNTKEGPKILRVVVVEDPKHRYATVNKHGNLIE